MNSRVAAIGFSPGSIGYVSVSGVGTTWETSDQLNVGQDGDGTLVLAEGAEVLARNVLRVGGLGERGSGILELGPGARVQAESVRAVSRGEITANLVVIGALEDVEDALDVGGSIEVMEGGRIFGRELKVGITKPAEIVAMDPGTQLDFTDSVIIGETRNAVLEISDEAVLSTGKLELGISANVEGTALIDGTGTALDVSGDLTVAKQGWGRLMIAGGATATSFRGYVGTFAGGTGEVILTGEGSTWTCAENLLIGGEGTGNLRILGGTQVRAEEFYIFEGGRISGTGSARGKLVNRGIVSPGESAGTLTIDGDYVQENPGILILEIGGSEPGQSDLLAVTGNVMIGGQIVLRFINGFLPREGDQFTLMKIGGSRDVIDVSFVVENLASGFQYDVTFNVEGELSILALNDGEADTGSGTGFGSWPILETLPADRRGPHDRNGPLGLPNLLAYAMAVDPLTARPEDLPAVTSVDAEAATIRFSYRQGKSLNDVTLMVKISPDLVDWGDAVISSETILQDNFDWERIEAEVTLPEGTKAFLKLEVALTAE